MSNNNDNNNTPIRCRTIVTQAEGLSYAQATSSRSARPRRSVGSVQGVPSTYTGTFRVVDATRGPPSPLSGSRTSAMSATSAPSVPTPYIEAFTVPPGPDGLPLSEAQSLVVDPSTPSGLPLSPTPSRASGAAGAAADYGSALRNAVSTLPPPENSTFPGRRAPPAVQNPAQAANTGFWNPAPKAPIVYPKFPGDDEECENGKGGGQGA
jgi:hypothetical protein